MTSYQYDPDGKVIGGAQGVSNPWRFLGGYVDSATGYELLGGRYYDPQTARYTQPSGAASLLEPLTWNAYPLAQDNAFNPAGAQGGSGASDVAPGNGGNGWRPLASLAWVLGAASSAVSGECNEATQIGGQLAIIAAAAVVVLTASTAGALPLGLGLVATIGSATGLYAAGFLYIGACES